ncbi:MAG: DNA polymerase-3 subunit chi, partial [Cognaticolwellia sp.]
MLTQAMFYSIEEQSSIVGVTEAQLHLHYACLQAVHFYRQNQRVFIYTQDQQSAHDIDEMLWAFDPTSFVPHNLIG